MKRIIAITTVVLGAMVVASTTALAALADVQASGSQSHTAAVMPTGNLPSAVVTADEVTLSWSASTLIPGPTAVEGYRVFRQQETVVVPASGSCAGTVAALTCTDQGLAPGNYEYTVLPVYKSWTGVKSPATPVIVGSAP
jgi:hypothetical protein